VSIVLTWSKPRVTMDVITTGPTETISPVTAAPISQVMDVITTGVAETIGFGDPALPATTPPTTPPVGWDGAANVVLTSADSLATAITNIPSGGGMYIIELTAGHTWTAPNWRGFIVTAAKAPGNHWVIFRTSNFANLPVEGDRLQPAPANDADLAIIQGSASSPHTAFQIEASNNGSGGASKVAVVGIKFQPLATHDPTSMVVINRYNDAMPANLADFSSDIIFYQCRFTSIGGKYWYGITPDGNNISVSCCDFFNQGWTSSDGGGAARFYMGQGIRIYNNGMQCESIPVFLSQNGIHNNGQLPTDVTIDHNYMWRPMAWRPGYHKNCFEIKGGERVLVEHNIFENSWRGAGSQNGPGIVIKNVPAYCRDILVRKNIIKHVNQGYLTESRTSPTPEQQQRVQISNNLFYQIDDTLGIPNNYQSGLIGQIGTDARDIRILHNTFVCSDGQAAITFHAIVASSQYSQHPIFRDNIVVPTKVGTYGTRFQSATLGGLHGASMLNTNCDFYTVTHNGLLFFNTASLQNAAVEAGSVIANNYFPTAISQFGFVDATDAAGDGSGYEINSGFYATASSTGGVLGADVPAILAATAKVLTGILS
jgi:hypothetical protein